MGISTLCASHAARLSVGAWFCMEAAAGEAQSQPVCQPLPGPDWPDLGGEDQGALSPQCTVGGRSVSLPARSFSWSKFQIDKEQINKIK